jgi:hypothetical protein
MCKCGHSVNRFHLMLIVGPLFGSCLIDLAHKFSTQPLDTREDAVLCAVRVLMGRWCESEATHQAPRTTIRERVVRLDRRAGAPQLLSLSACYPSLCERTAPFNHTVDSEPTACNWWQKPSASAAQTLTLAEKPRARNTGCMTKQSYW